MSYPTFDFNSEPYLIKPSWATGDGVIVEAAFFSILFADSFISELTTDDTSLSTAFTFSGRLALTYAVCFSLNSLSFPDGVIWAEVVILLFFDFTLLAMHKCTTLGIYIRQFCGFTFGVESAGFASVEHDFRISLSELDLGWID